MAENAAVAAADYADAESPETPLQRTARARRDAYRLRAAELERVRQRTLPGDYVLTARKRIKRDRILEVFDGVLDGATGAGGRDAYAVRAACRVIFEKLAMIQRNWPMPKRLVNGKRHGGGRGAMRHACAAGELEGLELTREQGAAFAGLKRSQRRTYDRALKYLAAHRLVEVSPLVEYARGEAPPTRAARPLNWRDVGHLVQLGDAAWEGFGIRRLRSGGKAPPARGKPREKGNGKDRHESDPRALSGSCSYGASSGISARAREDRFTTGDPWRSTLAEQLHAVVTPRPAPSTSSSSEAATPRKEPPASPAAEHRNEPEGKEGPELEAAPSAAKMPTVAHKRASGASEAAEAPPAWPEADDAVAALRAFREGGFSRDVCPTGGGGGEGAR